MARTRIMLALAAAALALAAAPAQARQVRIISVDGRFLDDRPGPVEVWPGQVVSLAADTVWPAADGAFEYDYRPVEDFLWSADDAPGDTCDPSTDCRESSNFEATDYGVNFYVPWDAPARITIEVRSRYGEGRDRIDLLNERARPARHGGYGYGLDGLGWWTVVAGDRVFVPYAYNDGWSPYVHGYWYWTSFGWTWYSYDPWGHVTDHYGHWRHHRTFGWIWIPDPLWAWRPAVVSFFFGGGYIGWWPYDGGWSHGYRHGYAHGYDDGYWMGYWAGRHEGGHHGRRHHTGCTMVADGDFYVPGGHPRPPARGGQPPARVHDISKVRVADRAQVERHLRDSVRAGAVGAVPGGGSDAAAGRSYVASKTGVYASATPLKPVQGAIAGAAARGFEPVRAVFERPAEYRDLGSRLRESVGATRAGNPGVRAGLGAAIPGPGQAAAAAVRPARGLAVAPEHRGEDRQVLRSWAPRPRPDAGVRPDAADLRVEARDGVRGEVAPRPGTGLPEARGVVEPRSVTPLPRPSAPAVRREDVPRPSAPAVRPADPEDLRDPFQDGPAARDRIEWQPGAEAAPGARVRPVPDAVRPVAPRDDDDEVDFGVDARSGLRPDPSVRPEGGARVRPRFEAPEPERVAPSRDARGGEPSYRPAPAAPAARPSPAVRPEAPRTWPAPRPAVRPDPAPSRPAREFRAPAGSSLRREAPRPAPSEAPRVTAPAPAPSRPRDEDRPSRPSFGGSGSSSGSSTAAPPPSWSPSRKAPAPGPARFGGRPPRR